MGCKTSTKQNEPSRRYDYKYLIGPPSQLPMDRHCPYNLKVPEEKQTFHYPDKKVFNAALELYNKQKASEKVIGKGCSTSHKKQHWECKGEIRASFQLCTTCKDLGKAKSFSELYFIDVMEVCKYRTILCIGCFGYILKEKVGTCLRDIEEKLKILREETDN